MTTILTTRTARWVICRHRCFERNDRQIKTAGGTKLQGQLQQCSLRVLKKSMFGCAAKRGSSRLLKTHGIIFSKMDLMPAMSSCLKGEGRRPLSERAFDVELPARHQYRYLRDQAQTFKGLGCIQRQSLPYEHIKHHLVGVDLWCRKECCC